MRVNETDSDTDGGANPLGKGSGDPVPSEAGSGNLAGAAPKRKRRLTPRQRKLVRVLVANPDLTLAEAGAKAHYAGDADQRAETVRKTLKTPQVQERLREVMDRRAKLKDDALLDKLEQGLEATKTQFFAHEGQVVDERETVDHATRFSYLGLAVKLKGHDVTKMEVAGAGGQPLIPGLDLSFLARLSKEELCLFLNIPVRPCRCSLAAAGPVIEAQVIPGEASPTAEGGAPDVQA